MKNEAPDAALFTTDFYIEEDNFPEEFMFGSTWISFCRDVVEPPLGFQVPNWTGRIQGQLYKGPTLQQWIIKDSNTNNGPIFFLTTKWDPTNNTLCIFHRIFFQYENPSTLFDRSIFIYQHLQAPCLVWYREGKKNERDLNSASMNRST